MIQYKAFIASSLDGFIARSNGSIDWLTSDAYKLDNNDFGYSAFMQEIDCIVMGRVTFEKVLSFEPYPFESTPVYVYTGNIDYKFESKYPIFIFNGTLESLTMTLEKKQFKTAYVDGGKLIQHFINERMLNEITITRIPILIGSGLPLFGNLTKDQKLEHIQTMAYPNGFVQSKYQLT
ncbi:dihydrofolate reductase family protein [Leptospira harrisiae]|uniref:Riboflavin biosynthesis protein RibD n=1 Tax=Leptospira harrisiae TaxID=2023189 RepID=A0A2N0AFE8_9LEPT|nr:dihydrofolate reductase family protein [Leptospira harrisiae]PJZ83018.1 riboflavin biosynthesis protein RibD [Leptospira harrisiae]PKA06530.1 riboflavin biosynthesis protein RibD [Leptospira harrisiae]